MYVIATVFCSNFHFSVSLHVPFSQFLFERDSYSNEYMLANIGFDTAENKPCKACPIELTMLLVASAFSIRCGHAAASSVLGRVAKKRPTSRPRPVSFSAYSRKRL